MKLYRKVLGTLDLEGSIYVSDPRLLGDAPPLKLSLSGQRGQVECIVDPSTGVNCAARLVWRDEPVDLWEEAPFSGGQKTIPVDTGQACFAVKPDAGRIERIGFQSGLGDGSYRVHLGSRQGTPACLVIDFGVLYESGYLLLEFGDFRHLRAGRLDHPLLSGVGAVAHFENFETRTVFKITHRGDALRLGRAHRLTASDGTHLGVWSSFQGRGHLDGDTMVHEDFFTLLLREPPPPQSILALQVTTWMPLSPAPASRAVDRFPQQ